MLVDLHAHTSGISHCCRIDAREVIDTAKANGFDGIAVTNHYTRKYYTDETYYDWIERYIEEWQLCRTLGEKAGLRIFCGVEVTQEYDPRLHMLIYGCDESFLRTYHKLCERSLQELYALCRQHDCALVQAHPFRGGTTVQNTAYLDGVEINCHPYYGRTYASEVEKAAKKSHLALTCGCDYHADTYRSRGGMFLPDGITTDQELVQYLLHSDIFSLQVHEIADGSVYKKEYQRY